jgi:hypothetical protein
MYSKSAMLENMQSPSLQHQFLAGGFGSDLTADSAMNAWQQPAQWHASIAE